MKTHKVRPVLIESKPQELILISLEDEKIEYKDTVYEPDNEIQVYELGELYKDGVAEPYPWYKVIARQSQIPPEYISKFIEQYNNGCVEDLEVEVSIKVKHNGIQELLEDKFYKNFPEDLPNCVFIEVPKLTNGFVTIVKKEPIKLEEDWEAKLAIKNIPELPHIINSVRELRRYYIDGIQVGYNARKSEEPISYTEEEVKSLFGAYRMFRNENPNSSIYDSENWFNENKKK